MPHISQQQRFLVINIQMLMKYLQAVFSTISLEKNYFKYSFPQKIKKRKAIK